MNNDIDQFTGCVLVGGLGTRLRACVQDKPKVLAEVCGRPFLDYILMQYSLCGIRKCVLCTGYLGDMISEHYGDNFNGMQLLYSEETSPLGTGGALVMARKHFNTESVIVTNGDSYFDIDLLHAAGVFLNQDKPAMLLLRPVDDVSRYGKVVTGDRGEVLQFCEKESAGGSGLINAGVYFFRNELIQSICNTGKFSLELELFPRLAKSQSMNAIEYSAQFIDIGVPDSYAHAQEIAASFQWCRPKSDNPDLP